MRDLQNSENKLNGKSYIPIDVMFECI